ncbi:MAG TPA: alpha/beta hydrolase-fold protein [Thermoplasmata archaeon]|nr:alpha/beta hydrolase-fold protein [Thermoplasmata archaeon]
MPLVEPVRGDPSRRRVTFVWRPGGVVDRPSIYTPIANPLLGEFELLRAGGTGVWWRSFLVPRGTRALYAFSRTGAPGASYGGDAWATYLRHLVADPHHGQRFTVAKDPDDPTDRAVTVSVLSLPGAPPWPYDVERGGGRLVRYSLGSRHLPGRRSVWVGSPDRPGGRRGPRNLVVAFDGPAYRSAVPVPSIVRRLTRTGRIGPTVVVLVGNAVHARDTELAHNPRFVRFLVDELLPWLRTRHGIEAPAERTVVAGSSLGGLAAAHAALEAPDRFGNVLAQSGAFLWSRSKGTAPLPTLLEEYARSPRRPIRFYLDAGQLERVVFPGLSKSLLDGVRDFRHVLLRRGYTVGYSEFAGGHDYACWAAAFGDGLRFLIGDRRTSGRLRPYGAARAARGAGR